MRAAIVGADAKVTAVHHRDLLPDTPAPGLVEFDAGPSWPRPLLEAAHAALEQGGPVDAVGIANQRASTVVWDRATGEPVAPGLGWQDLRTVGDCLVLAGEGIRLAPNLSATKATHLLDAADPDRTRDLCVGTVDTWVAWTLTEGALHVTDLTNAAVTGLLDGRRRPTGPTTCSTACASRASLPTLVDSVGEVGAATALPGAPPISGLAGDQQASLIGQGCVAPGPGQDHLRHRRDARRLHRARAPGVRHPRPGGSVPDRHHGVGTASSSGASRRSCSRPAPTSSGSATTSAS